MASTTLIDRHVTVHPEALLSRVEHNWISSLRPGGQAMTGKVGRRVVHTLLRRMTCDQMIVCDDLPDLGMVGTAVYGSADGDLLGDITVHDVRAYVALITEGAIGLGRGYIEGWWDSPDPMTAVRVIIRNIAPIDDARNRIHRRTGWATDRIRAVFPSRGRSGNREDIAAHYDLGNAFFELFLDETMTYSSAVFASTDSTLAEASLHKYDLLLNKLGVNSSHALLEIGTGWGGLAIRAAETTGCRVTTTTISAEQLTEARRRVDDAGFRDRIELLDSDWRDLEGMYDRVVSIEMIEAVDRRDYEAYFATIERCMKPNGLVAIQAICLPDNRYDRAKNTEDFIRHFVFPNGALASIGSISKAVSRATRMQIIGVEDISAHSAETLLRWRRRFEERLDDVHSLGLDDRFCRLWRFYLAYCEAGFRERHCTVNQIVLAGRDWRGTV
ncbi:MAG TPA: cyclopropane-fatty-acyl-phospholipid synthase family protein [Ilumatobacteraceae bacterium]|nr:cyclopropane-fatty-acyl-phospholipid synthase family protein [Ilumatobacteraceae bacterium]